MIQKDDVGQLLDAHRRWCDGNQREWKQHRAAYIDQLPKVWDGESTWNLQSLPKSDDGAPPLLTVNVNLVRPYVTSFLSSLYYRGINFSVEPDELVTHDQTDDHPKQSRGIQAILDRFFEAQPVREVAEQAFIQGLMYRGGCALKMGILDESERTAEGSPLDNIWVDIVSPWEAVWDRRSTRRQKRYMGHLVWQPLERLREMKDYTGIPSDVETHALPDGLQNRQAVGTNEGDKSYVLTLEFYDLTARTETDEGDVFFGEMVVYLLPDGPNLSGDPHLIELFKGPLPYEGPTGREEVPLEPVVLEPHPDYPHDSVPPVASVWELNRELNGASSVLANAYRRDAARKIPYDPKRVDEHAIAKLTSPEDAEFVPIDGGGGPLSTAFHNLQLDPVSDTLTQYRSHLLDSIQQLQMTSDQTRGKAGEYLTATEANHLVDYSETTIGRLRRSFDGALARFAQKYLSVLWVACKRAGVDAIRVLVDKEPVDVPIDALTRRWKVQVLDTASTPAGRARQLQEFMSLMQPLLEHATMLGLGEAMAAQQLDYLVDLAGLPNTMKVGALRDSGVVAPEPATSPEAAPLPPLPSQEMLP